MSSDWKLFCQQNNICLQYSSVYSPQQNGVAERMNRTLNDIGRSLLLHSGLAPSFWAEAIKCAAYIRNRLSTGSHADRQTPYQKLFGKLPNVSYFRVFGCDAYLHIPTKGKPKLSSKARKGTFIGYEDNSPMYKVLMWDTKKVEHSRNVTFDEGSFSRGQSRLMDLNTNPNLATDVFTDPFPDNVTHTTDKSTESTTASGSTTSESLSTTSSDNTSSLRRSTRRSSKPDRLSYDKLGFINSVNVWNKDVLLAIIDYVDHVFITVNNTPATYNDAITDDNKVLWIEAIQSELTSLENLNTWTLVDSSSVHPHNVLSSKWVFKVKEDQFGNVIKFKARLVVKGYEQQKGIDFFDTFSPVARLTSIRTLLALSAHRGMLIHQMDVNTAFPNAAVNEDIFMYPPDGLHTPPNHILKLNKALYGLKQAPREWNHTIHVFIISLGFSQSKSDPCIYTKNTGLDLIYIAIYVDDILIACVHDNVINDLKLSVSNRFSVKDLGPMKYFLGLEIDRNDQDKSITIKQHRFIERILLKFGFANANPTTTPTNPSIKLSAVMSDDIDDAITDHVVTNVPYREAVGSLMYLMIGSRPDLAFAVSNVSRYMEKPTLQHWNAVKHIFRYIRGTSNTYIKYGFQSDSTTSLDTNSIISYCDADWAGDPDSCKSTTGFITFFNRAPISWNSRLQPTVAKSSTEAEYIGLSSVCDEIIWLRQLFLDLDHPLTTPTIIYEDNQGAIDLSYNPVHHKRTKHINVRFHSIREKIAEGSIEVKHISTDHQIADIFTKALPKSRFNQLNSFIFLNSM